MNSFLRINGFIKRVLGYVVPVFVLFYIGLRFARDAFLEQSSPSIEQYKILIGAIGLTATLSTLSFAAKNSATDNTKKENYYYVAEHLFLATLFLIYALLIEYCSKFISINFITIILNISQLILFFEAACNIFQSFIRLQSTLPRIDR